MCDQPLRGIALLLDVPNDVEVDVTAVDTIICPPQLALNVIEQSLTP